MNATPAPIPRIGFPAHLRRLSAGDRPVLALHCSLANAGAFAPLAAQLAGSGAALTGFDLPGHGQSPDWPDPVWPDAASYHDLATAIATALAGALAASGPVDLIGHSFGATVALRLAQQRPDLTRSLALIEPVLFAAADPAAQAAQRIAEAPMVAALAAGRAEDAACAFLAQWGDGTPWAAIPAPQRARIAARMRLIAATAPTLTADAAGLLAPGRLAAVDRPTLLLEGARSPPVMAAICSALAAGLPQARRVTLPAAAHMLPITHPAETAAILRRLWAEA